MRQNEANYVKMVNNVLTGLETEAAKWKGIKPMQRVVADMQAAYAKISEAAQVQSGSNPHFPINPIIYSRVTPSHNAYLYCLNM